MPRSMAIQGWMQRFAFDSVQVDGVGNVLGRHEGSADASLQ